jgi:hypothetical protein
MIQRGRSYNTRFERLALSQTKHAPAIKWSGRATTKQYCIQHNNIQTLRRVVYVTRINARTQTINKRTTEGNTD